MSTPGEFTAYRKEETARQVIAIMEAMVFVPSLDDMREVLRLADQRIISRQGQMTQK